MIKVHDVLKAIAGDETTRAEAMRRFKADAGSLDRWTRRDQLAMVDAISRTEDGLEQRSAGRPSGLRERLRTIRRRLEVELDSARLPTKRVA